MMDLTHLHLILNHIPVIGYFTGFLLLVWGILRRYDEVSKTGLVVLVVSAVVALPVYLTGEPAEEIVENLPGFSEQFIELHEDAALVSLILAIVAGAAALFALVAIRFLSSKVGTGAAYVCLLISFVTGASMAYTANVGGQIRHSEIRTSQQGGSPTSTGKAQPDEKREDDDDH
jgi:uncharacterized membrane protein